jgi:hypothetical protein
MQAAFPGPQHGSVTIGGIRAETNMNFSIFAKLLNFANIFFRTFGENVKTKVFVSTLGSILIFGVPYFLRFIDFGYFKSAYSISGT